MVSNIPQDGPEQSTFNALKRSIIHLQKSNKKLKSENSKLEQQNLALDLELKNAAKVGAESIIPGIIPTVKQSLSDVRKDFKADTKEHMDSIKELTKGLACAVELEALKQKVTGIESKVGENTTLIKSVWGASHKTNNILKSVGIVEQGGDSPSVNIPSVLGKIKESLESSCLTPVTPASSHSMPPPPRSARNLVSQFNASISQLPPQPYNQTVPSTPTHQGGIGGPAGLASPPFINPDMNTPSNQANAPVGDLYSQMSYAYCLYGPGRGQGDSTHLSYPGSNHQTYFNN